MEKVKVLLALEEGFTEVRFNEEYAMKRFSHS